MPNPESFFIEGEENIEDILKEEEVQFLENYGLKKPLEIANVSIKTKRECVRYLRETAFKLVSQKGLNVYNNKDRDIIQGILTKRAVRFLEEKKDEEREE